MQKTKAFLTVAKRENADWQISNSEVSETSLDLSRWPQVRVQKLSDVQSRLWPRLAWLRCIIPRDALVSDNLFALCLRFTWQDVSLGVNKVGAHQTIVPVEVSTVAPERCYYFDCDDLRRSCPIDINRIVLGAPNSTGAFRALLQQMVDDNPATQSKWQDEQSKCL
jgi:hypothetical protein